MIEKIYYPFYRAPSEGELIEVAPSVFWFQIFMPFTLNHINLWLLEGEDSWSVVDTGLSNLESRKVWELVIAKYLKGKPIKRVVATHMHPDHVGLAGWLCNRNQGELWVSRGEYDSYNDLLTEIQQEAYDVAHQFYRVAGVKDEQQGHYSAFIGFFDKLVDRLPDPIRFLCDGELLNMGGQEWQVLVGRGHSAEHICLLCERLGIFISGDQLLPEISSNISVWPKKPEANPLEEWLLSCHRLKEVLDNHVLVLPAHGLPFQGARFRLDELIDTSERDLNRLAELCEKPQRVVDAFALLFKAEVTQSNLMLACGESRAYFNCLLGRQKLVTETDAAGVLWFRQLDARI